MTPNGLPSDARYLDALIRLSHALNLTMSEDELVRMFSDLFEELLPSRLVAIRLVAADGNGLGLVYANGRLLEDGRDRFSVTAAALEGLTLSRDDVERVFSHSGVTQVDAYVPVFASGAEGFGVALCDRENFYGMLNFEYAATGNHIPEDRRIALPLAHLMSGAIRNTRLIAETVFLKDYLEKLLDSANAPVVVLDRSGRITVVNQAMERLSGYGRSKMIGAELMSMVPDADRARLLPMVLSAIRGEPSTNIEVRIPRADGSGMAHIAFNTAAIFSPFGEVEGIIFVGQDLTEVRNLQKQVIHNEKLATLGQIAAGVAHELNNPLTSITVYANYLHKKLDGAVDAADVAKLSRIVEAAERIQSFTKDLVTYARPSGEEPVLVQIGELIDRTLSFCEHLIGEYAADVSVDVHRDIRPIYGIRGQLEQVLVNLLTNSCHALPADGGAITITARPKGDDRVEIRFADTGCGIPAEHLDQIFEPFFTTKDHGEGTGLGLSIVRNIIVNHDGGISVESDPGRGTTFTITLYAV
jgi:PAS domain S-box-containing protein